MPSTPGPKGALSPDVVKKLEALNIPVKAWAPHEVLAVVRGHRTLGELAGVTKEQQLEMAKTGLKFLKDGLKDKAVQVFDGLEALDPFDAYVQTCLGTISLDDEDWKKADARFSKAIQLNPESVPALYYRGELRLQRLGKPEEGIDDLNKVVAKDPEGKLEVSVRARAVLLALKKASEVGAKGEKGPVVAAPSAVERVRQSASLARKPAPSAPGLKKPSK